MGLANVLQGTGIRIHNLDIGGEVLVAPVLRKLVIGQVGNIGQVQLVIA